MYIQKETCNHNAPRGYADIFQCCYSTLLCRHNSIVPSSSSHRIAICSFRCQYHVFCVFSSQIYSFDVNEIYPVFDSDLCVYRCCVCILPRAIRLVSSSGESNLITYKSLDIVQSSWTPNIKTKMRQQLGIHQMNCGS